MGAGGIWDTKYLTKQLPGLSMVLPSTSLQPLYQALNPGGTPQPEVSICLWLHHCFVFYIRQTSSTYTFAVL